MSFIPSGLIVSDKNGIWMPRTTNHIWLVWRYWLAWENRENEKLEFYGKKGIHFKNDKASQWESKISTTVSLMIVHENTMI